MSDCEKEQSGRDDASAGIPLWAVELGCWTMVVLAPFLYWINGPAVSTDQLVVRSGLVGFAFGGGLALRLAALARSAFQKDECSVAIAEVSSDGSTGVGFDKSEP